VLLTDEFVFIHQPKAGGTFVTEAVERAMASRRKRTRRGPRAPVNVEKHGTCRDIPASHRRLPVLASFRHPWSRYVSQYHFARWKLGPLVHVDVAEARARWAHFPELAFSEFVEMRNTLDRLLAVSPLPPADRPGYQTRQFLQFYSRDPEASCRALDDASIRSGAFREGLFPVRFLRQERLAADLRESLLGFGYAEEDFSFLPNLGTVLPKGYRTSTRPARPWWEYWTEDLAEEVRHRERALWAIFPDARDALERARARDRGEFPSRAP
jgi:hypothetical protein